MTSSQSVNLPPWKVPIWFPRVIDHLKKSAKCLDDISQGGKPDPYYFPRLTKNWEDINEEENGKFWVVTLLEGWLVTDSMKCVMKDDGKKEKTYTWTQRFVIIY